MWKTTVELVQRWLEYKPVKNSNILVCISLYNTFIWSTTWTDLFLSTPLANHSSVLSKRSISSLLLASTYTFMSFSILRCVSIDSWKSVALRQMRRRTGELILLPFICLVFWEATKPRNYQHIMKMVPGSRKHGILNAGSFNSDANVASTARTTRSSRYMWERDTWSCLIIARCIRAEWTAARREIDGRWSSGQSSTCHGDVRVRKFE